jgi:hypothetical protein
MKIMDDAHAQIAIGRFKVVVKDADEMTFETAPDADMVAVMPVEAVHDTPLTPGMADKRPLT